MLSPSAGFQSVLCQANEGESVAFGNVVTVPSFNGLPGAQVLICHKEKVSVVFVVRKLTISTERQALVREI
jgi:hypothetical protein